MDVTRAKQPCVLTVRFCYLWWWSSDSHYKHIHGFLRACGYMWCTITGLVCNEPFVCVIVSTQPCYLLWLTHNKVRPECLSYYIRENQCAVLEIKSIKNRKIRILRLKSKTWGHKSPNSNTLHFFHMAPLRLKRIFNNKFVWNLPKLGIY